MPAEIQVEEIVWLVVDFDAFPDRPVDAEGGIPAEVEDGGPVPSPPQYNYRGRVELQGEDSVYLFAQIELAPPVTEFAFSGELGVRFRFADAADYEEASVRSTLLWMTYPYVREMVSTVTARSPQGPHHLPPLTRMPDPAAVEGVSRDADEG